MCAAADIFTIRSIDLALDPYLKTRKRREKKKIVKLVNVLVFFMVFFLNRFRLHVSYSVVFFFSLMYIKYK